jgi:deoxynucleoside triphosphate triphosphohydrolase SAMHD1
VDLPDVQGIAEKTRFYVGDEITGIELYTDRFNVERWAEAYENQKSVGYVFSPHRQAAAVHLAARDLMAEDHGLMFDGRSMSMTKLTPQSLSDMVALVRRSGRDVPDILIPAITPVDQPLPTELLERYHDLAERLARKFQSFESHTGDQVNAARILMWLSQFPAEAVHLAAGLLLNVRYWNRRAIVDALSDGVRSILSGEFTAVQALPLGGPTTSGHHLSYYWPDVIARGQFATVEAIGAPERLSGDAPVVFYDDNIGLGAQSKTVLQQWWGRPREEWFLDEKHVEPLTEETRQRLRATSLYFLFVTGRRRGLLDLIIFAKALIGSDRIDGHIVSPMDTGCFRPQLNIFVDDEETGRAERVFRDVGRRALGDVAADWGNTKVNDRLLGYGNFGGLTVFQYNVPSSTLTALWMNADREPRWLPLFHRRRRL